MKFPEEMDLVEQLTDLLLENGCTVNKPAMLKLVKAIVVREQDILGAVIRRAEELSNETARQATQNQREDKL